MDESATGRQQQQSCSLHNVTEQAAGSAAAEVVDRACGTVLHRIEHSPCVGATISGSCCEAGAGSTCAIKHRDLGEPSADQVVIATTVVTARTDKAADSPAPWPYTAANARARAPSSPPTSPSTQLPQTSTPPPPQLPPPLVSSGGGSGGGSPCAAAGPPGPIPVKSSLGPSLATRVQLAALLVALLCLTSASRTAAVAETQVPAVVTLSTLYGAKARQRDPSPPQEQAPAAPPSPPSPGDGSQGGSAGRNTNTTSAGNARPGGANRRLGLQSGDDPPVSPQPGSGVGSKDSTGPPQPPRRPGRPRPRHCGKSPLGKLPAAFTSQQALRSCPIVVGYLVGHPGSGSGAVAGAGAPPPAAVDTTDAPPEELGSSRGPSGNSTRAEAAGGADPEGPQLSPPRGAGGATDGSGGRGGGKGVNASDYGNFGTGGGLDGLPLCSWGVVMNNGRDNLYGWQLVWRFSSYQAYQADEVEGAVLVTAGNGSPVRVVNSGDAASIPPQGGAANFSMSLLPNISTPGWSDASLEWTAVYVNGQRCVQLPSVSLGLPKCGRPYGQVAAAAATNDTPPALACASVFCCGELDSGIGAAVPIFRSGDISSSLGQPADGTDTPAPAAPPDSLSQLSSALSQLTSLIADLLPPANSGSSSGGTDAKVATRSSDPFASQLLNPQPPPAAPVDASGSASDSGILLSPEVLDRLKSLLAVASNGSDVSVELLATLRDIVQQVTDGGSFAGGDVGNGTAAASASELLTKITQVILKRTQPPRPPSPPSPPSPPDPPPSPPVPPTPPSVPPAPPAAPDIPQPPRPPSPPPDDATAGRPGIPRAYPQPSYMQQSADDDLLGRQLPPASPPPRPNSDPAGQPRPQAPLMQTPPSEPPGAPHDTHVAPPVPVVPAVPETHIFEQPGTGAKGTARSDVNGSSGGGAGSGDGTSSSGDGVVSSGGGDGGNGKQTGANRLVVVAASAGGSALLLLVAVLTGVLVMRSAQRRQRLQAGERGGGAAATAASGSQWFQKASAAAAFATCGLTGSDGGAPSAAAATSSPAARGVITAGTVAAAAASDTAAASSDGACGGKVPPPFAAEDELPVADAFSPTTTTVLVVGADKGGCSRQIVHSEGGGGGGGGGDRGSAPGLSGSRPPGHMRSVSQPYLPPQPQPMLPPQLPPSPPPLPSQPQPYNAPAGGSVAGSVIQVLLTSSASLPAPHSDTAEYGGAGGSAAAAAAGGGGGGCSGVLHQGPGSWPPKGHPPAAPILWNTASHGPAAIASTRSRAAVGFDGGGAGNAHHRQGVRGMTLGALMASHGSALYGYDAVSTVADESASEVVSEAVCPSPMDTSPQQMEPALPLPSAPPPPAGASLGRAYSDSVTERTAAAASSAADARLAVATAIGPTRFGVPAAVALAPAAARPLPLPPQASTDSPPPPAPHITLSVAAGRAAIPRVGAVQLQASRSSPAQLLGRMALLAATAAVGIGSGGGSGDTSARTRHGGAAAALTTVPVPDASERAAVAPALERRATADSGSGAAALQAALQASIRRLTLPAQPIGQLTPYGMPSGTCVWPDSVGKDANGGRYDVRSCGVAAGDLTPPGSAAAAAAPGVADAACETPARFGAEAAHPGDAPQWGFARVGAGGGVTAEAQTAMKGATESDHDGSAGRRGPQLGLTALMGALAAPTTVGGSPGTGGAAALPGRECDPGCSSTSSAAVERRCTPGRGPEQDGRNHQQPSSDGPGAEHPVGGNAGAGDGGSGSGAGGAGDASILKRPLRSKQTSWVAIDFARDVVLERRLGSGAYGTVYRGRWAGRPVACKVVPLIDGTDGGTVCPQAMESIRQEVQVLSRLSHPHIVQFYGACLAPPNVCIVEELAAGGSLHNRLHAKRRGSNAKLYPPMTYFEVLRLGLEVASALAYLHPHVVHRDLKPQNVLLDASGRAKVCDFGIAKIKDRTLMSTRNAQAGTPAYMAPEQFEGRPVSEKVDVYAYGMTLYECLTGEQPWRELQNPMQVIFVVGVQCQRPPLPAWTPPSLAHLITSCWADNPDDRPPFTQIVPWIQAELESISHRETASGAPAAGPGQA